MVVYWGMVDQMFMTMMTFSAKLGSFRKLMPVSSTPILMSRVFTGPVTLNINMKIMVSALLEVSVGRK